MSKLNPLEEFLFGMRDLNVLLQLGADLREINKQQCILLDELLLHQKVCKHTKINTVIFSDNDMARSCDNCGFKIS